MICPFVQSRLSAYLDSELGGQEMLRVQAHIRECPACAAEIEELRALKRMMASMADPSEPPVGFEEKLLQQIATPSPRRSTPALPWGRMIAVTGVAAALTWLAMSITLAGKPASEPTPNSVAFEVKRDQAFMSGADSFGGSNVMTVGLGGR